MWKYKWGLLWVIDILREYLNSYFVWRKNLIFLSPYSYDSAGKESACNAGGLGSIPGLGRFPGVGNGYPLQNSKDLLGYGVTKSRTWLSDFHFHLG